MVLKQALIYFKIVNYLKLNCIGCRGGGWFEVVSEYGCKFFCTNDDWCCGYFSGESVSYDRRNRVKCGC